MRVAIRPPPHFPPLQSDLQMFKDAQAQKGGAAR
jgi:hypothetical protein